MELTYSQGANQLFENNLSGMSTRKFKTFKPNKENKNFIIKCWMYFNILMIMNLNTRT